MNIDEEIPKLDKEELLELKELNLKLDNKYEIDRNKMEEYLLDPTDEKNIIKTLIRDIGFDNDINDEEDS
jgi:hypothetical protein